MVDNFILFSSAGALLTSCILPTLEFLYWLAPCRTASLLEKLARAFTAHAGQSGHSNLCFVPFARAEQAYLEKNCATLLYPVPQNLTSLSSSEVRSIAGDQLLDAFESESVTMAVVFSASVLPNANDLTGNTPFQHTKSWPKQTTINFWGPICQSHSYM